MKSAPISKNERERLSRIVKLGILNTKPEKRFDVITLEATKVFNVSISTVTIIDEKREWYKSCQGLNKKEASRVASFCAHTMQSKYAFVVEDTLKDERFKDNPMVVGKPYIRFYAGVSLYDKDGIHLAVFCIKDIKPRSFSIKEVATLIDFGRRVEVELNKPIE